MDVTYDEYIEYINHLMNQEMLDTAYHFGHSEATVESLKTF
jgi:hypothetical protein